MPTLGITVIDEWRELVAGFATLEHILRTEGGEHLLPGIRFINGTLSEASPDDPGRRAALEGVRATLKNLLGHKDLLADFFVWRDDFDERKRANEELKELISRLSRLIVHMLADGGR